MAVKGSKELAVTNGSLGEMANVTEIANSLATVILDKKLAVNVQGKNYVLVEGWQLAGAYFGIVPIIKSLEQVFVRDVTRMDGELPPSGRGAEIKYRAEVELLDTKNNRIVGYGVAVCSSTEKGKGNFEEFAIASMAQTRAVGKAYRLSLGWVIKLAGYEGTPAEEMEGEQASQPEKTEASDEDKKSAFEEAKRRTQGVENG